jgi:putative endonuclease
MARILAVYIMASYSRCLYTGVSGYLVARVGQHRDAASASAFTARYRVRKLVYYEYIEGPLAAIAREKQIKSWTRKAGGIDQSIQPAMARPGGKLAGDRGTATWARDRRSMTGTA